MQNIHTSEKRILNSEMYSLPTYLHT